MYTETLTLDRQNRQEIYLHLQLTAEIPAVIPLRTEGYREGNDRAYQVREVLTLALDRLTPLPDRPHWVMGLLNQRSRIFWVLDLADFLGLSPLENDLSNPVCVLLQVRGRSIGFGARQIKGVLRLNRDRVESLVGKVSPTLEPYLRGSIGYDNENLFVIEPLALVYGASARLERQD
jgi:positive phototaxis protein PixI